MPDDSNLLRLGRAPSGANKRGREFSNVTCGAFYSASDTLIPLPNGALL